MDLFKYVKIYLYCETTKSSKIINIEMEGAPLIKKEKNS